MWVRLLRYNETIRRKKRYYVSIEQDKFAAFWENTWSEMDEEINESHECNTDVPLTKQEQGINK